MTDPRDTARRWLAEVLHGTGRVFSDDVEDIADAILSAPGVQVRELRHDNLDDLDAPKVEMSSTCEVVIRLPAKEGTGT